MRKSQGGQPAAAAILLGAFLLTGLVPVAARSAADGFSAWLEGVRAEGLKRGLKAATLDAALEPAGAAPRALDDPQLQGLHAELWGRLSAAREAT